MPRDEKARASAATSSLIWGIVALFAWLVPPVGALAALAGLVLGSRAWHAPDSDRARLGVALSVLALLLSTWLAAWILVVAHGFPITNLD